MNEEELKNSGEETEFKTAKLAPPSAKEIIGSLELTVDFLEGVPDNKRYTETTALVANFVESNKGEIDILAKEQELLYIDLIKKGLDGFLELRGQIMEIAELSDDEKQKRIQDLDRSYKNAKQLRQMARAQALEGILANFMNPYLWTAEGGDTYNYDPGFETATRLVDEKNGKYESRWDSKVHFHKHLGKFLSESDVKEIRKFIEGFFEQTFKIDSLSSKVTEKLGRKIDTQSYDPKAAELILSELGKLPAGVKLGAYTRVVVGQNSISIILSDSDYDSVCKSDENERLKSSGGVHFKGTVLNLARNTFRTYKTISHEDEHALNDNLLGLHRADISGEAEYMIASYSLERQYSEGELENMFEQVVLGMVATSFGEASFMTRFADEVLANKLGNKDRVNEEILEFLNNSELYYYLNITDENIADELRDLSNDIGSCLGGGRGRGGKQSGVLEKMTKQHLVSPQVVDFFWKRPISETKPIIQKILSKESVLKMRETIIAQVDRLITAGTPPEKIRALLSANNPLLWKDIVDMVLKKRDIPKEDKTRITQSFKDQGKKIVDRAEKLTLRKFRDFGEMPEEEKNNFSEIDGVASQLVTGGYKMVKNGFSKEDNYKEYKCALRKIEGANAYTIILDQYFDTDPHSQQTTTGIIADIKVHSNIRTAAKSFSTNTGEILTVEKIESLIKEAENEAGIA